MSDSPKPEEITFSPLIAAVSHSIGITIGPVNCSKLSVTSNGSKLIPTEMEVEEVTEPHVTVKVTS